MTENINNIIWRYMDLSKFIDLIQSQSIFFTKAEVLAKEDRFEGFYSFPDYQDIILKVNDYNAKLSPSQVQIDPEDVIQLFQRMLGDLKQYVGISSWCYSAYESNAMWKIYSKNNGIAVKTTVDKLYYSFKLSDPNVLSEKIQYEHYGEQNFITNIDELINILPTYQDLLQGKSVDLSDPFYTNLLNICLPLFSYKRRPFKYENEYRFITLLNYPNDPIYGLNGNKLQIDFNQVIDEIHISPDSEPWLHETIKDLLTTYKRDASKLIDPKFLVPSKL